MIKEETNNKISKFTDLKAWQEAYKLILMIYALTKGFPREELYSLVDQMRRSSTSVASNIAEGFGRQGYKEKIQFYYLAKGLGYSKALLIKQNEDQIIIAQQLLHGLIRKSKSFINP